ncbi:MAG: hypothetical protein RJA87_769 [Pseudomonadota bacterium]|jgi:hypothetical protein
MIRKTVIQTLTMATVIVVCSGVSLVASALGLFVLLRGLWGEVIASVLVAGLFAVVALTVAFCASRPAVAEKRPVQALPEPAPIFATLMAVVREKPLVSAAVAAVAGIIAVRNPQLISSLIATFLDDTDPKD